MVRSMSKSENSEGFSIQESSGGTTTNGGRSKQRRNTKNEKRRSSFFQARGKSFWRSGGERGADLKTIRGTSGPDFESNAMINRADMIPCSCFGGSDVKERLILIRGSFIFVYSLKTKKSPKYAIGLAHLRANFKGESSGFYLVKLETALGEPEYEFSFASEATANNFVQVVDKQAIIGESEEVRKHLGHEKLITKKSSMSYAEDIALKKVKEQPKKEAPLTTDGILPTLGQPNQLVPM